MGLFDYIGAALSSLRQPTESKAKARSGQNHASRFRIEQLEPRILLSADLVPEAVLGDAVEQQLAPVVLYLEPANESTVNQDRSGEAVDSSQFTPNIFDFAVLTTDEATVTAQNNLNVEKPSSGSSVAIAFDEESSESLGVTSFDTAATITDQLTETLRVANAPPMLPEMRLVQDDLSRLNGQMILLDFDGASRVNYNGPVRVDNVEVYPFQLPTDLAGSKSDFIGSVLTTLNERFAALGVTFTTAVPPHNCIPDADDSPYPNLSPQGGKVLKSAAGEDRGEGNSYSTIFVGGNDSAFSQYGSFFGLAEQVDIGNRDRSDNAFVFSDKIFQPGMSAEGYASALTEVVAHEAAHLLGYAHADGQTEGLSSVAETPPPQPDGARITVNSVDDSNERDEAVTLREAILISNRTLAVSDLSDPEKALVSGTPDAATRDTIEFSISGDGVQTIFVSDGGLPYIIDPVFIDGETQPGFNFSTHLPLIQINASGAGVNKDGKFAAGLEITAGNSVVQALAIGGAPGDGIRLRIGGGNIIIGNFIGTDATGNDFLSNRDGGVLILDSADNQIGGHLNNPAERNLISGNRGVGISILDSPSTGNHIEGNLIGTNLDGNGGLGNGLDGILLSALVTRNDYAGGNFIGGLGVLTGNVISANGIDGVTIVRGAGNQILQNFIGTTKDGTRGLANGHDGIFVIDAPDTQIGGAETLAGNVISANVKDGIEIVGSGAKSTVIQQNSIGTDLARENDRLGNGEDGIYLHGNYVDDPRLNPVTPTPVGAPVDTKIGGTNSTAGNFISGNDRDGVRMEDGTTGTLVQANYIGLDGLGENDLGNKHDGVAIISSPNNTIGGVVDEAHGIIPRNVISANGTAGSDDGGNGVFILGEGSTNNRVLGNYIGTREDGLFSVASDGSSLGNKGNGVFIRQAGAVSSLPGNMIGDTTTGGRNVISGNEQFGVLISGEFAKGNTVLGNYIGTDRDGEAAVGNAFSGVAITKFASANIIGGDSDAARNVISGNIEAGVIIFIGAFQNKVWGNFIGIKANGKEALPNEIYGVDIIGASDNDIGGVTLSSPW